MSLSIDIRDPRIDRLCITARTTDVAERDRRKASLMQLLESERGRAIVERLRRRELTLEQVHAAVRSMDLASLEPAAEPLPEPEVPRDPGPMLGATIDAWMLWLAGADRSKATLDYYGSILRSLESHFGVERSRGELAKDHPVADITRAHGEAWLTGKRASTGKPWAPRSQTVAHSIAAQLWDRAILADEEAAERSGALRTLERNFWRRSGTRKGVRPARIRRTRVEFLRRPEAARLLRMNKGFPHAAWIAVGLYAGLRGGEAANLRVGLDVDLTAGVLRIQGRGGLFAWRTKTDNSVRDVPIHPRLARWLRNHKEWAGDVYLFRQPKKDQPLDRGGWRTWTKVAFERAGIRYGRQKDALVYHSLRHSFASWLTMKDVHPLKIAKLMGDTVEMVIRTYSHLVQEDLREAVLRL